MIPIFSAAPKFNIKVLSQNALKVVWSNDDKNGTEIKFQLCWMKDGEANQCRTGTRPSPQTAINGVITRLQAETKYIIGVARYSKDGKILSEISQKVAITHSG